MRLINESAVTEEQRQSPKGNFEIWRKHVSLALGGIKDVGTWGGGHPFDIEVARIPVGRTAYPFHSHAAQTEYYIVLAGSGTVVDGNGTETSLSKSDHCIFLPGEAHQISNRGLEVLEYIVIADHHRADVTTYPKTGKRMLKPELRCGYFSDAAYYEGEE